MKTADPFHKGERFIQEQANERDTALSNARLIEDHIITPAHKFLSQQSYICLSAESKGVLSGTIAYGQLGFLSTDPEGQILTISLAALGPKTFDPFFSRLSEGDQIGALVIDFATRRRLRLNGIVTELSPTELKMSVGEAWPTCPKYIQKRYVEPLAKPTPEPSYTSKTDIDQECENIILKSDTFFIASVGPNGQVDMSNRGGNPGFIKVAQRELIIPDYKGNSMFNTLGNFHLNPKAALVFWDFERSRFLHLWGKVKNIIMNDDDLDNQTTGTGRFWIFEVERLAIQVAPLPFELRLIEVSPFNPEIRSGK